MPQYFQYSPWTDAAAYGQGLGQTLGQVLLQMPREKAEEQRRALEFPLQQQLLQAQLAHAQSQTDLYKAEAQRQKDEGMFKRAEARKIVEGGVREHANTALGGILTSKLMTGQPLSHGEGILAGQLAMKDPHFANLLGTVLKQKLTGGQGAPRTLAPGSVVGSFQNGQFSPSYTNSNVRFQPIDLSTLAQNPGLLGTNTPAGQAAFQGLQQKLQAPFAPQSAAPATNAIDLNQELQDALDAIHNMKRDPDAVRKAYQQRTGQVPNF